MAPRRACRRGARGVQAALALLASVGAGVGKLELDEDDCLVSGICEKQLDAIVVDIRERIVAHLGSVVSSALSVGPTALVQEAYDHRDGLLKLESVEASSLAQPLSGQPHARAVLDDLYYKHDSYPELFAVWFQKAEGRLLGVRRALPCEVSGAGACAAAGVTYSGSPVTNSSRIAMEWDPTGRTLTSYVYDPEARTLSKLSDQAGWGPEWQSGATEYFKANPGVDLLSETSVYWTDPYTWLGRLGAASVAKIAPTGTYVGMLITHYDFAAFETLFTKVRTAGDTYVMVLYGDLGLLGNNRQNETTQEYIAPAVEGGKQVYPERAGTTGTAVSTDAVVAKTLQWLDSAAGLRPSPESGSSRSNLARDDSWWSSFKDAGRKLEAHVTVDGKQQIWKLYAEGAQDASGKFRVVVIGATNKDGFYQVPREMRLKKPTGCVLPEACRDTLTSGSMELRVRGLMQLQDTANGWLGTATSALNELDLMYNLGAFDAAAPRQCGAGCGAVRYEDVPSRERLRTFLWSSMKVYSELAWMYVGWDAPVDGHKPILGYLREPSQDVRLWILNTNAGAGSTTTAAAEQWTTWDNGTQRELKLQTQNFRLEDRPWYKAALNDPYDSFRWHDPYVFSDGSLGITCTKRAFGGGFTSGVTPKAPMGVFAADFTLGFIENMLKDLQKDMPTSTLFIIDARTVSSSSSASSFPASIIASTSPRQKDTNQVIGVDKFKLVEMYGAYYGEMLWQASTVVLSRGIGGWRLDKVYSGLFDGKKQDGTATSFFVDWIGMRDVGAAVSYDWALCSTGPEVDQYNLPFAADQQKVDGEAVMKIVIIGVVVCLLALLRYVCPKHRLKECFAKLQGKKRPPSLAGHYSSMDSQEMARHSVQHAPAGAPPTPPWTVASSTEGQPPPWQMPGGGPPPTWGRGTMPSMNSGPAPAGTPPWLQAGAPPPPGSMPTYVSGATMPPPIASGFPTNPTNSTDNQGGGFPAYPTNATDAPL
eukprot:TRINITY_DN568_c0_g1_i1.p1 TRINITY_DN568_c0_g1~~TRINITY_DN568_c0_g1_i1.p1  ORF type:complete len:1017 (+),score=220.57 TRINITY_DN568_c0_g1_i1:90-3053(+)